MTINNPWSFNLLCTLRNKRENIIKQSLYILLTLIQTRFQSLKAYRDVLIFLSVNRDALLYEFYSICNDLDLRLETFNTTPFKICSQIWRNYIVFSAQWRLSLSRIVHCFFFMQCKYIVCYKFGHKYPCQKVGMNFSLKGIRLCGLVPH